MADESSLRPGLVEGLRFCHLASQDLRTAVDDLALTVVALVEELAETGLLPAGALEGRKAAADAAEEIAQKGRLKVRLLHDVDKYTLTGPDVRCEELIPLCRGRCCTLHFPLGRQDLDERIVEWNHLQPYTIRQRQSDLYCVHSDPTTRGCTLYEHRPAVCRSYDCRNDRRIWADFERRIPAVDPKLEVRDVPVPHGPPPNHPR